MSPRPLLALLFLQLAFSGSPSRADDGSIANTPQDDPKVFEQIVVTPGRRNAKLRDVPVTVESLSSAQIRMRDAARTLPEALAAIAGVSVQKTAHGQGSPYIRGFTGFRTLLLIDGIRLNNSVFRDGPNQYWSTVNVLNVDRLEVAKGPSSALYGSDAIGGTVNAVTPGAAQIAGQKVRLYTRFSTAERSGAARVETSGGLGSGGSYRIGAGRKRFGDLVAGGGTGAQPKTGYDEFDLDGKLEWAFGEGRFAVLAHQGSRIDDAWRTHRTIFGRSWRGTTVGSDQRLALDQERSLTYLQFRDETPSFFDGYTGSLSFHAQSEDQDRVRSNGQRDLQGFDVGTTGVWATAVKGTPIGLVTGGFDVYYDRVGSYLHQVNAAGEITRREIQGPVGDDASYLLAGLFVQDEIRVRSYLTVTAGLRLSRAVADAEKVRDPGTGQVMRLSRKWQEPTFTLRFLLVPPSFDGVTFFGGASQGFRAPNLSDLTRYDIARTRELETPSPDLDPERYLTAELGARMEGSRARGQMAIFRTAIDGQIIRVPTGRMVGSNVEVRKGNSGDGFIQGAELSGSVDLPWSLHLRGTASILRGRLTQFGGSSPGTRFRGPIDKLAAPALFSALGWRPPGRLGWWVESSVSAARPQRDLSIGDRLDTDRIPPGGTPGHLVWSVRGGVALHPRLQLRAGIENLTNVDYRIHGSGVNAPGRNLVLALDFGL